MRTRKHKEKLNIITYDGRSLSRYMEDFSRRNPVMSEISRFIFFFIVIMLAEVGIIHILGMMIGAW